jgi:hypothetical protein
MRPARAAWGRDLALLLCAASACHPKAVPEPRARVVEIRVVDRTGEAERPAALDAARLERVAADELRASSGLPIELHDDPSLGGPRYRLRVEVRLEEVRADKRGLMRAYVTARLAPLSGATSPSMPGPVSYDQAAVAEHEFDTDARTDAPAAWAAHQERAVRDVLKGLGARVRLAGGDQAALARALAGGDEDLRDEAIRVAGERRDRAATALLVPMLKSEDHTLRDRAIGALAQIGDPRSVRPLTEVARFRDLSDLPKVLDALASIGGADARAYLEFVASGHDSKEMREMAEKALAHLDRREALALKPTSQR